jgi:hypothetical protein
MPTDRNVPTLFQRLAPFFPLVVQRGGVVDDSSSPRWAQSWPAVVPTYVDIVGSKAALRNRTDAVRHRYLASRLLKDWAPWLEKAQQVATAKKIAPLVGLMPTFSIQVTIGISRVPFRGDNTKFG